MRPLLKLCGNHSVADTAASFASSADYVGFVFAKSKRQVTQEQVRSWLDCEENKQGKKLVALFVNASIEEITLAIKGIPFDIIQCHGNESVNEIIEIKKRTGLPVWKVIHHHETAIRLMGTYKGIADGYIIDCKVGDHWGGTGVSFDWRHVPVYIKEGRMQNVPLFIAGGIHPGNVSELLRFSPDGIDISSGIEENGHKSHKLIRQLEERMYKNDDGIPR